MPDLLRKIFLPDSDHGPVSGTVPSPGVAPRAVALDSALVSGLAPDWQAAPAALALHAAGEVVQWNPACAILLRETLGGSDEAGRRWLAAAVSRLLAGERQSEVLAGTGDTFSLEVRLGSRCPASDARLVAVREIASAGLRDDDLVETVSTLSHELRTPLTSMKSSLRLVLSGETGEVSAEQARFLDMTMRNIDRLERLVSDLLDVSRTQTQTPLLRRRDCDLGPVLREAVHLQEAAARQSGLELDVTGLPASYAAHVDPDKVVQILTNVVGNAVKYTPAGGLVRVWLEARPRFGTPEGPSLAWQLAEEFFLPLDTFNLVVEDSGVGLSQPDQDRVFEPWFRAEQAGSRRVAGAGLGLHITRSLVEAHGGRIRLASEAGRGTTVWIRLPRDLASEQLVLAARRLRSFLAESSTGPVLSAVAVLDGRAKGSRPALAVADWARSFVSRQSGRSGVGEVVALGADLMAAVATDPAAWQAAWQDFRADQGLSRRAPEWRLLTGPFGEQ